MASETDAFETQNVDDIIAQYDNDDYADDISGDIDVDDLLNEDLVNSTLQSPLSTDTKPKLSSSLPKPVAPDLPSKSQSAPSVAIDNELDIESILNGDNDNDNDDDNDALLEFDPNNIDIDIDIDGDGDTDINATTTTTTSTLTKITKYSDIALDSIDDLLKREEIRMKQRMETGNYEVIEPLTKRRNNRKKDNEKESFFKLQLRESMTKTLEHHRAEYGAPTFVCSHTKFIAMGMKNGSVFIFDHFEQLKVELTPSDLRLSKMGSVTCLDFNHNGTNLIVGYFGGQLLLWDIIHKKELKKIKDAHSSPIIFVYFYRRGTLRIASCDSNGIMLSVFIYCIC